MGQNCDEGITEIIKSEKGEVKVIGLLNWILRSLRYIYFFILLFRLFLKLKFEIYGVYKE